MSGPLAVLLVSAARPSAGLVDITPIAERIATRRLADSRMIHWSDLEWGDQGLQVAQSGSAVDAGKRPGEIADRRRRFDVVLFFPTSNSSADWSPRETSALDRLDVPAQVRTSRYAVVRHLLVRAACCGQITNATAADGIFGIKSDLARVLAEIEAASGCCVPHPKTWRVHGPAAKMIGAAAAPPGSRFVFKPENSARGLGIKMDTDFDAESSDESGTWIMQVLLADPLLVDGYKADIRSYVVIDTSSRTNCSVPDEMLVRLAAYPYQRGVLYAELTNSSVRERLGIPQSTSLLATCGGIPPQARSRIAAQVKAASEQFLDSYFWFAQTQPASGTRVLVWGLDFFIGGSASEHKVTLLEVNAYPSLFVANEDYGDAMVRVVQSQLRAIADARRRRDATEPSRASATR
jgi:hypothetical protein